MSSKNAQEFLKKHGWNWEWKERKPRKLFTNEEFQFLRPEIRREA